MRTYYQSDIDRARNEAIEIILKKGFSPYQAYRLQVNSPDDIVLKVSYFDTKERMEDIVSVQVSS